MKRETLDDLPSEFPRPDERFAGLPYRHGWYVANINNRNPLVFNSIAHIDFGGKRITRTSSRAMQRASRSSCHARPARRRAMATWFDLLTFFAGLGNMPVYFLYPFYNQRTDEYGGSFENRIRFTREVLEEVRAPSRRLRDRHPLLDRHPRGAVRARRRRRAPRRRGREFIEALDDLVDYWDLNIGTLNWGEDAGPSRFFESNHQAPYTRTGKAVSKKPCVNVAASRTRT